MTDTVPLPDMDGLQGLPIWDAIGLWATADQGAYATAMAACVDAEILKAIHSHAAAVSAADNAALRAEVERVREIAREAADAATDHQKSVLILRKRVEELEAALRGLLDDTQHSRHADCQEGPCPVREARALLSQPKEPK